MEQTTLLIEEHNLHRLKLLGELSRGDIGVDVQDLAISAFRETCKDGKSASADGSLQGALVHAGDLAHETVFILVEVVGSENARSDGTCASPELLERSNNFEILLLEYPTSNLEGLRVCGVCSVSTSTKIGGGNGRFYT